MQHSVVIGVFCFCSLYSGIDSQFTDDELAAKQEEYRTQLWVRTMQHTTYAYYLKAWQRRKFQYRLYKTALEQTTPLPQLSSNFFEKGHEEASDPKTDFVSLTEVFSRPRTIDDEIGMPIYEPVNNHKIVFGHYNKNYPYGRR